MCGDDALAGCNGPDTACTSPRGDQSAPAAVATGGAAERNRPNIRGGGLVSAAMATAVSMVSLLPVVLSSSATVAAVCIAVSVASLVGARVLVGVRQRHDDQQMTTGAGDPLIDSEGVPPASGGVHEV